MKELQKKLHTWYQANKRDLPWRHTADAYKIWLSEIMLQQTQVVQGLPYYLKFVERFPLVADLAAAQEEEVLKLWQGLGYYSRARNLHAAAKQVMQDHQGLFPTNYNELIQLKGVGDYTASAVASFSSGEARACVDGNVIRVVCRLFGIDEPYDTGKGKKIIASLAQELLDEQKSALHNQAMMEFGALQCTPQKPQCDQCPLASHCLAFANGMVAQLPVKSKRTKVKDLFMYYFVFLKGNELIIRQRTNSGIWKNMYEFPLLESESMLEQQAVLNHMAQQYSVEKGARLSFSKIYTHILSHRRIQASFVLVKTELELPIGSNDIVVAIEDFEQYPVSTLIHRYWSDFISDSL